MAEEEPEDPEEPVDAAEEAEEASEAPDEAEGSGFNWWLTVIPALAVLDLVIVLLYGARILSPSDIGSGVEIVHVVIAGAVILVALLVVEAVLLAGGHPDNLEDDDEPAPGPETTAARDDVQEAPSPDGETPDLEALATDDEVEGRRVLEMARPPKDAVEAGVYSTTYVEVDHDRVLRVEELVAERSA